MRIVSILENQTIEKRIAITPEIAKKYIAMYFFAISGVIAILFSIVWFSKIETILIENYSIVRILPLKLKQL